MTARAATSERNYIEAELKLVQERLTELPTLDQCTTVQETTERMALNQQRAILRRAQKDLKEQGVRSSSREVNAIVARSTLSASDATLSSLPPLVEAPPPARSITHASLLPSVQTVSLPSNTYSSPLVDTEPSPSPSPSFTFLHPHSSLAPADTQPARSSSHAFHSAEADWDRDQNHPSGPPSPVNAGTSPSAGPATPGNNIWEVPSGYRGWAYTNAAPEKRSIGVSPSKAEQVVGKRERKQSQRWKQAEESTALGSSRGKRRRRG
jgi:hypothetical protein